MGCCSMLVNIRDRNIIFLIIEYCEKIGLAVKRFGNDRNVFVNDVDYQSACGMYVYQIGELTIKLSDEFKEEVKTVPWREIKGMRNIFAHEYGEVDEARLWDTIQNDLSFERSF